MAQTRTKRLLINNADRFYNLNLIHEKQLNDLIKVNPSTIKQVKQQLKELKTNLGENDPLGLHKHNTDDYLVFDFHDNRNNIIDEIIRYGDFLYFYTNQIVQDNLISKFAKANHREIVFDYDSVLTNQAYVDNIKLCHMACSTSMYIDFNPLNNPYDLLFKLYNFKYNIDRLYFHFKELDEVPYNKKKYFNNHNGKYVLKAKYKFLIYKAIKVSISIWSMNLYIITGNDIYQLRDMGIMDKKTGHPLPKRRKSITKKV